MKYLGKGKTKVGQIKTQVSTGRWLSCAAGIDIHKLIAVATVLIPNFKTNEMTATMQKFGTSKSELERMRQWFLSFKGFGLECYGIEATSTYYRPVEFALRNDFKQVLINPFLLKEKRKTDEKDSHTIAYVVLSGLFKPNFVIPEIQTQLKAVNRRIIKAQHHRVGASNAIGTTLINFNIQLTNELKAMSASSKAILRAIIDGETDPEKAAEAAVYYSRNSDRAEKFAKIVESLHGLPELPDSIRTNISLLYKEAMFYEMQVEMYTTQLSLLIQQYKITLPNGKVLTGEKAMEFLQSIDGCNVRYGQTFICECGIDMQRFPTSYNLESYVGVNPEKRYSADKVTSVGTPIGNKFIHSITIQCAQALLQTAKADNPLARWGREYKMRNGNSMAAHNMAVSAIGKRITRVAWHCLSKCEPYKADGYNFDAVKKNSNKKVYKLHKQVDTIKNMVNPKDMDEVARIKTLEMINSLGSMIGIETQFRIVPKKEDGTLDSLEGLSGRTKKVLLADGIDKVSTLVYRWSVQTLMDVPHFGEKSYQEVVSILFKNGFIVQTS